jgi:hypothetical protein
MSRVYPLVPCGEHAPPVNLGGLRLKERSRNLEQPPLASVAVVGEGERIIVLGKSHFFNAFLKGDARWLQS